MNLLLNISLAKDISLGDFHPALIHFPIALFCIGLVCDILYLMGKKGAYPVGHWMVIFATACAIPTIISGLSAAGAHADHHQQTGSLMEIHKFLAFIVLGYGVLHSIFRFISLRRNTMFFKYFFTLASLVNVALVGGLAEYGGVIVRGRSIFIADESSASGHQHNHNAETIPLADHDHADGRDHEHPEQGKVKEERKVKYYKSTMSNETSPVPAKDSMGMDMVPVYEDEADKKS